MNDTEHKQRRIPTGIGIMLLSALIFGYFGFSTAFVHHSSITGKLLIYVPILEWTLKGVTIAFVLSAVITLINPLLGNLLYSIVGLLTAVLFIIVAIMDIADTQHMVMSPIVLILFAAWNGFGSWAGIVAWCASMRSRHT